MKLEIQNSSGGDNFPIPNYRFSEGSLNRRIGAEERFGKHGAFLSGDRKWKARKTSLIGDINAKTDAEFIAEAAKLVEILDERFNPYFIVDTENNRRIEFDLDVLNPGGGEALTKRLEKMVMRIILPEVAWEDIDETVETSPSSLTDTGETISVENKGQLETYPIITIIPTAKNTAFTIFNNTIDDLISIGSGGFTVGTTIEINGLVTNGEVLLDDGNTTTEISSAVADRTGFFVLAKGVNEIEYESAFGKVDIEIRWRNRYLF